jgi:hypothetical protein
MISSPLTLSSRAPVSVVQVGHVRVCVFRRGVLMPVGVPARARSLGMVVSMVAVVMTVAVGVMERFVDVRV